MHRTCVRSLYLAAMVFITSGCTVARYYKDAPLRGDPAVLVEGKSTKSDVLRVFGPPQEIEARELTAIGIPFEPFLSRRGDKPPIERIVAARFFRYTYTRANAMAIILVLFNYGDFDQKSDNLVIFFDGDNKVEDFAFRRDTDQLPRFGFWSR